MVWVGYSRREIISWVLGPSALPDSCHILAADESGKKITHKKKKKPREEQMGLCLEDIRSANAPGPG